MVLCFLSKISRLALFYMVVVSSLPVTAFSLSVLLACFFLHCSSLRRGFSARSFFFVLGHSSVQSCYLTKRRRDQFHVLFSRRKVSFRGSIDVFWFFFRRGDFLGLLSSEYWIGSLVDLVECITSLLQVLKLMF